MLKHRSTKGMDKSLVSWVDEDEEKFNVVEAKALDVNTLGEQGFLVSGDKDPKTYAYHNAAEADAQKKENHKLMVDMGLSHDNLAAKEEEPLYKTIRIN